MNSVATNRKIVAFAYACDPQRGSEPGAGWAWARILARIGPTWVITRRDYRESIEEALQSIPERENLTFVYVELPDRYRSWQRDLRGLRIYYIIWQLAALKEARRLRKAIGFDIVWHLTWASAWMGSLSAYAGRPFIYGPVGGCVGSIWRLLPHMGMRGAAYEIARGISHSFGRYLNPMARVAWRRADLILVQNDETRRWLPARHRHKARVFPNAVAHEEPGRRQPRSGPPTLLFAGRLEAFKGVSLVIRALHSLPGWELIVCGAGSDERRLHRLAAKLGVEDRIAWMGWQPRDEIMPLMREKADLLMFPSAHEEAGLVVLEAVSVGLPVVAFDRGGPPLLARDGGLFVSSAGSPRAVAARLADAARRCLESGMVPSPDSVRAFTIEERARALLPVVGEVIDFAS